MKNGTPRQRSVSLDERQQHETDAGHKKTYRDQLWLAVLLHEPADKTALDVRADEPAEDKQRRYRRRRGSFVSLGKTKIINDQQRKRAFKTTESKGRQEKDRDE